MITREAGATWNGDLEHGNGTVRSAAREEPYSFATRFGEETGTNPDEMIGSALAGCFSMALAHGLSEAGHEPESVDATARVQIDPEALEIPRIELSVEGRVPGLDADAFREAAREAKQNCPVSKALAGVEIVLTDVRLA